MFIELVDKWRGRTIVRGCPKENVRLAIGWERESEKSSKFLNWWAEKNQKQNKTNEPLEGEMNFGEKIII